MTRIKNPQVRDFWLYEFAKYSAWLKSDATAPVLNKVGQYLATPVIRNILGQPESSFTLRETMDQRKILIANLAKGKIGEDNCSLLGAMLITQIQLAALSRHDVCEKKRVPFYLYVDELHSFATQSFADILSEARKYGLSMVVAHQYVGQLDEKIKDAVFGNVGTLISFRIGQEDACVLAREFAPVFDATDLVALANHHIYLKLLIDGVTSEAFSAETLPPPRFTRSYKSEVIKASRETYAQPRATVELEILRQAQQRRSTQTSAGSNRSAQRRLPL